MNKRRIYRLFYHRFHGEFLWRSKEEQAWLDVAPVGREFGSPDYDRLLVLDLYAAGHMGLAEAIRKLGIGSLEELEQQMQAAGLTLNEPDQESGASVNGSAKH
jgi:hypothetical protein